MKLTVEKAYELSVKKWQYIVENNGSQVGMFDVIPELRNFPCGCPYCELFNPTKSGGYPANGCPGCPIDRKDKDGFADVGCFNNGHPYKIWALISIRETAQAVLNDIINKKPF